MSPKVVYLLAFCVLHRALWRSSIRVYKCTCELLSVCLYVPVFLCLSARPVVPTWEPRKLNYHRATRCTNFQANHQPLKMPKNLQVERHLYNRLGRKKREK